MKARIFLLLFALALLAAGCAQGTAEIKPPEIRYGEDVCVECIMIISDPRFAAAYTYEVSPGRYENQLFDDIGDMLIWADKHPEHNVVAWWVHDYNTKEWVEGTQAIYMFSHNLQTPMAQGTAAFAMLGPAQEMAAELNGEVFDWNGLVERHKAGSLMVDASLATAVGASLAGMAQPQGADAAEPILQGEAEFEGYQVQLLSAAPLHAGYNPVTVALTDPAGQPVADAQVTLAPYMDMVDGRHHGAGVQAPAQTEPGVYNGALIFPMPSGPDLGTWLVTATFTDTVAGASGSVPFPLEVAPSKLHGSFVGPEEMKIFVSVVEPLEPRVGRQPFEVYVMQKRGMFEWPTLDDLLLEITPEMPTMGHGSPGNENPVAQGDGHYLGKVNFSMSGPWTVTVVVKDGDAILGEVVLEYDVP
ncbi:MAG: FixH family protein [Caldilineales bacterium]